ncbi:MAG: hypothetical protein QM817_18605 [Archangium sp.]
MLTLSLSVTLLLAQAPSISGTPRSAYLLAQADVPPPIYAPPPEAPASAQQLQVDIAALKRMRPGIGGGIALVASGGGLAIAGGFYTALGVAANTVPIWVMGIVALSIGAPLAVVGIWLLVNAVGDRERINTEIGKLQRELSDRQRLAPPLPGYAPSGFSG